MQTEFARTQMITQQIARGTCSTNACSTPCVARRANFRARTLRRNSRLPTPTSRSGRAAHARAQSCRTAPAGAGRAARHARAGGRLGHRATSRRAFRPWAPACAPSKFTPNLRRRAAPISSAPDSDRWRLSRVTLSTWIWERTMRSLPYVEPCPCTTKSFARALAVGGKLFVVVGDGIPQEALLVTRTAETAWSSAGLFETAVDALENAQAARTPFSSRDASTAMIREISVEELKARRDRGKTRWSWTCAKTGNCNLRVFRASYMCR